MVLNKNKKTKFSYLITVGFLFSMFGDIILIFDGEVFFIFGLLSFLVTHIMYLIAFIDNITSSSEKDKLSSVSARI